MAMIFTSQRAPSSLVTHRWTYDVFLSFRGEDTRSGFTGHLYNSLRDRGIKTFIDDEGLRRGEEITPALSEAIQQSRIAVIVFSENYASSTFCLNELVQILECVKEEGRLVFPVFYDVDPSDVRHQRGSYGEALALHLNSFIDNQKLQKWRFALFEAANLSGWHVQRGIGYEYEVIGRITDEISRKINRTPLYVTEYPVGLVSRVQKITSLLDLWSIKEVKMVGICGIGGLGKSTIARAVYNLIADHFEGLCFLSDVREISNKYGLSHLQETLLYDLVKEKNLKLRDVHKGISIIEHRLTQKKVLLILDDVDKLEQLRALAGKCEWFGLGSRIIITTRDKHLLMSHGVERIYDVEEFNDNESLQLFHWNAFKKDNIISGHMSISNRAIHYCSGLPLALEVIGSHLCGKRIEEWASAFDKYERIPTKQILEVLKISYDGLQEDEKEVFLDLACFFIGNPLGYVIDMLRSARGSQSEFAIGVLIDRSLIKISYNDVIIMHDLIQDMGKEIVRRESPKDPGSRSKLWSYEDIVQVLQENTGTKKIEAIILDLPQYKEVQWSGKAFKKMKNLKLLIVGNANFSRGPKYLPNSLRVLKWSGFPSKFLPSGFQPGQLVHLDMSNSSCVFLKLVNKKLERLTCMNFSNCKFLTKVPDLSGASNLTKLHFDDCSSLIEIHDSVGLLDKIREFSAERCSKLRTIPHYIKWTSLEHLRLSGCSSLQNFPEILDKLENMTDLNLTGTAIEELPSSICNLIGLEILNLRGCKCLKQLPTSICMLPKLWILMAKLCSELRYFKKCEGEKRVSPEMSYKTLVNFSNCNLSDDTLPLCLSSFPYVICLDLSFNNFTILPACLKECHFLKELSLNFCKQLQHIAGIPLNLEICEARNCTSLTSQSSSMFLDQALRQPGKKSLILPGQRIPEWFDHYNEGKSVSFWVRKEFPAIVACLVVGVLADCRFTFDLSMRINGFTQEPFNKKSLSTIVIDHMFLCDLQSIFPEAKLPKEDEWNHVEVKCMNDARIWPLGGNIKSIGVHVCKQVNNMENIRFTNPNPPKRTSHYSWNSNMNGVLKKQRTSLDIGVCAASKHKEKDVMACDEGRGWLSMRPCSQESWEHQNWDSNSTKSAWTTDNSIKDQDIQQQQHSACLTLNSSFPTASKYKGNDLKVLDEGSKWLSMLQFWQEPRDCLDWDSSFTSACTTEEETTSDQDGQLECQSTNSSVTTNIQAPSRTAPSKEVTERKLHTVDGSPRNQHELSLDDIEAEAFYAGLDAEASVLSPLAINIRPNEETQRTLETLQDMLSKDFSVTLYPEHYSTMRTTLDYLSNLSADGGVSAEMRSLISQISREFSDWSRDYENAGSSIELSKAKLLKADEIEERLGVNKKHFREAEASENKLQNKLASLEERKKEIEEQLNAIEAQFSVCQSSKVSATKRKREVFEEGKTLKAQRDELREQVPCLRHELESAKETQACIRSEWSKLGVKFKKKKHAVE